MVATNVQTPLTGTATTGASWRVTEPNARVVNFGTGQLKATQHNYGAAVGLNIDQVHQILNATSQLGAGERELEQAFRNAYTDPDGELTPEANRIAGQLHALRQRAQLATVIRSAMVQGDRHRLKFALAQAGLPYGEWIT